MRIRYTPADDSPTSLMPWLSLTLQLNQHAVQVVGLLDTGSAVSILPYQVGLELGAAWDEQTIQVPLAGSLGHIEARALVVFAFHPEINPDDPVRLVFAWIQTNNVPLILGQMNFFMEFDVCFYRSQDTFDVRLRGNE